MLCFSDVGNQLFVCFCPHLSVIHPVGFCVNSVSIVLSAFVLTVLSTQFSCCFVDSLVSALPGMRLPRIICGAMRSFSDWTVISFHSPSHVCAVARFLSPCLESFFCISFDCIDKQGASNDVSSM